MSDDLDDDRTPIADKAIFWPVFALFVVLLFGIYVITAPPGSDVVRTLFGP
jgi:hypothetical protein